MLDKRRNSYVLCILLSFCAYGRGQPHVNSRGPTTLMKANVLHEYPESCYILRLRKVVSAGSSWDLPECGRITCVPRVELYEYRESCPKIQVEAPCYISSADTQLSFPMCCPKKVCPGDREYSGAICPQESTKMHVHNPHV